LQRCGHDCLIIAAMVEKRKMAGQEICGLRRPRHFVASVLCEPCRPTSV